MLNSLASPEIRKSEMLVSILLNFFSEVDTLNFYEAPNYNSLKNHIRLARLSQLKDTSLDLLIPKKRILSQDVSETWNPKFDNEKLMSSLIKSLNTSRIY